MIIAIDGPAASGKGTLGKRLAAHYRLRHLDTGLLYRAVGKAMLDGGHDLADRHRAAATAKLLAPTTFEKPNSRDMRWARRRPLSRPSRRSAAHCCNCSA